MQSSFAALRRAVLLLLALSAFSAACPAAPDQNFAQPAAATLPSAPQISVSAQLDPPPGSLSLYTVPSYAAAFPSSAAAAEPPPHRFWDRENILLFSAVGASRTLDYFSTLNMRRRGDHEVLLTDDVVDNHAAFAVIEAAGTAVSIGASYLFHHYHHHRLERWTSIIHAGLATSGAVRNYCLPTAHPSSGP